MAQRLESVAALAVERAAVDARDSVLDIATGTGNAALLAAARGARTVGIDVTTSLLVVAEQRALAAGAPVEWLAGDLGALPVQAAEFDAVLSVFGVMYASDPARAAAELAGACRPGGRLVLANWTPDGFMAATGRALAPFLPPPPAGAGSPMRWGEEQFVRGLLEGAFDLRFERHAVTFSFPSAEEAAAFWIAVAGHAQAERPRLVREGRWDSLLAAVQDVFAEANVARHGGVRVASEYLLAVGARL